MQNATREIDSTTPILVRTGETIGSTSPGYGNPARSHPRTALSMAGGGVALDRTRVVTPCAGTVSLPQKTSHGSRRPMNTSLSITRQHSMKRAIVLATTSLECAGFANTERNYCSLNSEAGLEVHQHHLIDLYHYRTTQHQTNVIGRHTGLLTDVHARRKASTPASCAFRTAKDTGTSSRNSTTQRRGTTGNTS